MARELSWEDAVLMVLREAGGMMRYTEIAEQISARALKKSANPSANVAATLSRSIREEDSPFLKLGKGEYTLKSNIETGPRNEVEPVPSKEDEEDPETGALKAFGMYWQRDHVIWSGRPRMLGRQSLGASDVNFGAQVGVYLLHDRDRIIYVGRATDTMFSRLKFHTVDRLSGRWDRFSWFGLKSVDPDGGLSEPSAAWSYSVVLETLEALLIESLEPPLNRKRGDNFSGAEYIQVVDPEIEKRRRRKILADMAEKIDADEG